MNTSENSLINLRERQDVVRSVAKGGNGDGNHIDPIIEIAAEAALSDGEFEVGVGRADDPRARFDRRLAADAGENALI